MLISLMIRADQQVTYMATHERQVQIVGYARRRRYSVEEKAGIVAESFASSVAAVCERYNLAARLLYTWRSRYKRPSSPSTRSRQVDAAVALPAPAGPLEAVRDSSAAFVHVATVRADELPAIRVKIAGDVALEFPVDIDPTRIAAVVRALRD